MSMTPSPFYITGGTLRQAAACCVARLADHDLYEGQKTGDRDQRSEDRDQKAVDRGQRTEDGEEVRGPTSVVIFVDLEKRYARISAAKLYLNGKQIYRYSVGQPCVADVDVMAGVAFKAGLNVLVFKVLDEAVEWRATEDGRGSVRFTNEAGPALKGVEVSLDPDEKAQP